MAKDAVDPWWPIILSRVAVFGVYLADPALALS